MLLLLLACTVEPAPPAVPPEQRDTAGDTDVDTLPACADGLPARAFDPAGTGVDYLGVAPGFVLPTQSGDWSLAEHWTGCDSYLFLGIDADDGYTGLLLAENAKKLFTQGPANVHYFFFATARATEAEAAQAGIAAVLEEGLASLNVDAEAWWRERVHVVTSTTQQTDGWVGALLSAYQYPTFGIDRAQTIREVGYLANPGNGWTTVEWPALGYEAEHYNFEAARQEVLDAQGATVVRLWDNADTQSDFVETITATLPDAAALAAFNRVDVDVTLGCAGPWYETCPPWDGADYLWVCDNDDPATEADESADTCQEMARLITAYWRGGRWVMDGRTQLSRLLDGGAHTFRYTATQARIVTVDLRFYTEAAAPRPFAQEQLWWDASTLWTAEYDGLHALSTFTPPADATRVELVTIVTGHGSDSESCGEFCNLEQTWSLNGAVPLTQDAPMAGDATGCIEQIGTNGQVPNQAGTWGYGRNGWCPGMGVAPKVWDVTDEVTPGAANTLAYQGLYEDAPYVTSSDGNVDVGIWLVYSR
jgi:hypothetical protein